MLYSYQSWREAYNLWGLFGFAGLVLIALSEIIGLPHRILEKGGKV